MALCIAVGTSMSRAIRHRASSAMLGLLSVGVALSDLCTYVEHCHHHILRTANVEASTLQRPMIING
jgi:hypothetical protein